MVRHYQRKTMSRWTKDDLLEALIRIKDSNLKINKASREYGISRATLYRQYQKFIVGGGRLDAGQFRYSGGNRILSKVEEDVMAKTMKDLRGQGFTVTGEDIREICFKYCEANGIRNKFNKEKRLASRDWYQGFLKRHPEIKLPEDGEGDAVMMTLSGAEDDSSTGHGPTIEDRGRGRGSTSSSSTLMTAVVNVKPPKKSGRGEAQQPDHE